MQPLDFDRLLQSSLGFYRVWIIHLGRRYGILQALAKSTRGATIGDLAKRTGLHPKGLNLWCEAAYSLGIVTGRVGRYRLAHLMEELLVDDDEIQIAQRAPQGVHEGSASCRVKRIRVPEIDPALFHPAFHRFDVHGGIPVRLLDEDTTDFDGGGF
jgi:hypothetical protein